MMDMSRLLAQDDPWIEILKPGHTRDDGRCVLLWVQRAKRASMNRAANVAVMIADRLELPVAVAFVIAPGYPAATLRSYRFMAEGLQELPAAFNARGIGWILQVGDPVQVIPALAVEFDAAAIVTDRDPLRTGRTWRREIAERLMAPFIAVDSDTVAPPFLFPKEEFAARTLRPKLWRAIVAGDFLAPLPDPAPRTLNELSAMRNGPDPLPAIETLTLDRTVPSSPRFRGGRVEALARLDRFIQERLATYPEDCNRSETETQSELSPYLHFGQISPLEIALAAIAARVGDQPWTTPKGHAVSGSGAAVDDAPLASFLDELVTQRELAVNFCLRDPGYDRWAGLPEWGRATLHQHTADARPVLYSRAEIEAGQTGDWPWNAAQRQMVHEGYMPNRLRMYWAKQLLNWTQDPEDALDLAVSLNDRYFIDGRDANGYAGVAWSIGGRHDRPFPPNKPVLGLVRPMTPGGMARKMDIAAYIRMVEVRTGSPVLPVPEATPRERTLGNA